VISGEFHYESVKGISGEFHYESLAKMPQIRPLNMKFIEENPLPRFLIAILLMPLAVGCQSEIAKWSFAAAVLEAEAGNLDAAIPKMKEAAAIIGDQPTWKLELAKQLAEVADPQSVQLCDEVLKSDWVTGNQDRRKYVMQLKSRGQQSVGDFGGALETCKKSMEDHVSRSVAELNELAYCRALADQELMLAMKDIDKAFAEMEDSRWQSGIYLPVATKTVIAIGLLAREMDTAEKRNALNLLNHQIEGLENDFEIVRTLVSQMVFSQIQFEFPLSEMAENQTRLERNRQDLFRGALASALTVRALLHQDLGHDTRCNDDRYRVQELGFDASVLSAQMPDRFQSFDWLGMAMMVLDTRGFIIGKLPWTRVSVATTDIPQDASFRLGSFKEAIANLDLAVEAVRVMRVAMEQSVIHSSQNFVAETKEYLRSLQRNEAVLLYHRMLVQKRQGNTEAAALDEQRIRELGFKPDERLF